MYKYVLFFFLLKFCVVNWTEAMVRSDLLALAFLTVLLLYSWCLNPSRLDISSSSSCNHVSSGGLRKEGMWTPSSSLWFLSCLVLQTFTRFEMDYIFDKENKIFQKKKKMKSCFNFFPFWLNDICVVVVLP